MQCICLHRFAQKKRVRSTETTTLLGRNKQFCNHSYKSTRVSRSMRVCHQNICGQMRLLNANHTQTQHSVYFVSALNTSTCAHIKYTKARHCWLSFVVTTVVYRLLQFGFLMIADTPHRWFHSTFPRQLRDIACILFDWYATIYHTYSLCTSFFSTSNKHLLSHIALLNNPERCVCQCMNAVIINEWGRARGVCCLVKVVHTIAFRLCITLCNCATWLVYV